MKGRIYFWYIEAFHKKPTKHNTVDVIFPLPLKNYNLLSRADNILSSLITKGLIDSCCDAGILNFGVEKVVFNFRGSPRFISNRLQCRV